MGGDGSEPFAGLMMLEEEEVAQARKAKWKFKRIGWPAHAEELAYTNQWHLRYHMSAAAFNLLVDILRPLITVDAKQLAESNSWPACKLSAAT